MNKGLELIEAYHLFPVTAEQLDVVVHPQSIMHASSATGRLGAGATGVPRHAHADRPGLAWPQRMQTPTNRLDLAEIGNLSFEAPDEARFPALGWRARPCAAAAWRRPSSTPPTRSRWRPSWRAASGSLISPATCRDPGGGGRAGAHLRPQQPRRYSRRRCRGAATGTIAARTLCVACRIRLPGSPVTDLGMGAEIAAFACVPSTKSQDPAFNPMSLAGSRPIGEQC